MRTALLFLLMVPMLAMAQEPMFGSYYGVLRHHSLQRDQLASLDLIFNRKDGDVFELLAILKLSFGEASRGEYVSYVFNDVRYNPIAGTLAFDQVDQGLTIIVTRFVGERLEGSVRAPLIGSAEVSLLLERSRVTRPQFPLLREMTGTYASRDGVLELQAFRSPTEKQDGGASPFGENEIRGHLARLNPGMGGLIVDSYFTETSYDFFKGTLQLFGNLEPLSCDVGVNELVCEGEVFARVAPEPSGEYPSSQPVWEKSMRDGESQPHSGPISGQYWGYVHNESRNQYHLAGLNVVSLPPLEDGKLELSAIASLHFGDHQGVEALAYKYEPTSYTILTRQLVFKSKDNEAILRLTSWGDGVLRGDWYSRCFGRVGTFELHKDKIVPLPRNLSLLRPLRGMRSSDFWNLQLRIAPRPVAIHSANPFSPLAFGGIFWDIPRIAIPKSRVSGGSYDFYTGRIFLPVEVSGESLYFIGEHRVDGTLDLRLNLSNQFSALYNPQKIEFSRAQGGLP